MRLVDTHAHLDFPDFDVDRAALIKELADNEIGVINIATDKESVEKVDDLCRDNELVWGAIGLHPTEVGSTTLTELPGLMKDWKQRLEANPKIVAIGEIGLDYFHDRTTSIASAQKAALRQMLTFAQEMDKPVIFHCRDAYGDLATILADYKIRGVIHCFSGTQTQADAFLQLDFYLSATAIVTYPKNEGLRQTFKNVPAARLMLETDSPFLPPQGRRGERNDPRTVIELSGLLATLRGVSAEELQHQTTQNAETLFNLN